MTAKKTAPAQPEVDISVRLSATAFALEWARSSGVDCHECILGFAKKVEDYLTTGVVPEHEDEVEGVIFTMDPETDPTKN